MKTKSNTTKGGRMVRGLRVRRVQVRRVRRLTVRALVPIHRQSTAESCYQFSVPQRPDKPNRKGQEVGARLELRQTDQCPPRCEPSHPPRHAGQQAQGIVSVGNVKLRSRSPSIHVRTLKSGKVFEKSGKVTPALKKGARARNDR
jgi:hypothetical protein